MAATACPECNRRDDYHRKVLLYDRGQYILRIGSEEPSEFQDKIRNQFPQIELEHGFLVRIPRPGSGGAPAAEAQSKIYRFRTPDGETAVSLAVDFYAVSTNRYTHWEDFIQYLAMVDEAVQQVYQPAYATRIGLRYVNRLTPKNTACRTLSDILDLLHFELTAYARNDVWTDPAEMRFRLILTDGDARLTLRTGHGYDADEQPFFMLDFDYFEEGQLPLADLLERCDRYHDVIYRAFRWCVPDENLSVFKPVLERS